MRLAIVGPYPRDPERLRGGVEAVTLQLARGLAREPGLDVHVVVSEAGRPRGERRGDDGVTVHSVGGAAHLGNVLFQVPDRRRIAAAVRALEPDVVHAHGAHREALGALESGRPTVVTIHGLIDLEIALERRLARRLRGVFRRRVVRAALARMRHVIVLSPYVRDHYGDALAAARTWVIENPVHERFFEAEGSGEPGTILFAGRIVPLKGLANLLEALALLSERRPGVRLRIAGPATDRAHADELRARAEALGVADAVVFLGALPPAELAAEMERCAVFALVSRQEVLPVALLEAMAAGKPVVASPVGGVPALVADGETGFLVPWGEPAALAERLAELLGDDALRARLGERARREALARFTLEAVSRRHLDVYREVIAAAEADRP